MDTDSKHTLKATKDFFKGKKWDILYWSFTWFQPIKACISHTEDKTKGRKTHKQVAAEGSWGKDAAKPLWEGHVLIFWMSGSHWLQKDICRVLKAIPL